MGDSGDASAVGCVVRVERPDLVHRALAKALGRDVVDRRFTDEEADAVKVLANQIGDRD